MINRFPVLVFVVLLFGQPIPTEAQVSRAWILWERHGDNDFTRTWRIAEAFPTYQACRDGVRVAIDSVIARNPRYGRDPLGMKDVVMERADGGAFLVGTDVFRICLPDTISDPRDLRQPPLPSREPWVLWRNSVFGPPPVESWTISAAVPGYDACEQRKKERIETERLVTQSGGPFGSVTIQYLCLPSPLDPRERREPIK